MKQKYLINLFIVIMTGLTFNLIAQDTFLIEAEDYTIIDPTNAGMAEPNYVVVNDETASGGKYLQVAGSGKTKEYCGYEFTTTNAADTIYYVWVKTRPRNNYWDTSINKHFFNWSIPDSIIERGGTAMPFQGMTYNNMNPEMDNDNTMEWKWYLCASADVAVPFELNLPPGDHNFLWRIRAGVSIFDQIIITNDLDWRPDIAIEFEAEDGVFTEPLVIASYSGASGNKVVSAPIGSGSIGQMELTRGNDDITAIMTQAEGDYYLWLLVDFPSESSNSYWIGTGDEQIMPPSWEGDVTSGLEWQQVKENGVAKVFPFTPGAWHGGEILRVKQQEDGTKTDKILLTNNINFNPITSVEAGGTNELLPKSFVVSQNYPNPFNPSTTITYALPEAGDVEVNVYSIIGEKIATLVKAHQSAGVKEVTWNAGSSSGGLSSGIYFYSVKYGDKVSNKKMLLLK
ncbi:MAG: T9SS type A sorting domain-containing protein [Melioribacteraceae bacterium]|nr:T9SS type A sorting domain-containing protein [Melioribacteraceae bacterium]